MSPITEMHAAMDDTMGAAAAEDPITALLIAIDNARPYVAVSTPRARRSAKNAGLVDMPAFDPYARVLADLRNALVVVMSVNPKPLTPQ